MSGFVDIHCHLLAGIDDGAEDVAASLVMARMAVADGISTVVATPHQLGSFEHNGGDAIRRQTAALQAELDLKGIPLKVLPGADVRIDEGLIDGLVRGDVLTLADRGRHVLLELPHDVYFPIDGLLAELHRHGVVGILSHPERNAGLLRQPELLAPLVDAGCLMQVTAGSLTGSFGPRCRALAEWMLSEGLIHFLATDAHGAQTRRPILSRASQRVRELTDEDTALDLCSRYPTAVMEGRDVPTGRRPSSKSACWPRLFRRRQAG